VPPRQTSYNSAWQQLRQNHWSQVLIHSYFYNRLKLHTHAML